MTKPTLTYFDVPVSRGEECRLAFFIANVPFTDERLKTEQWQERKAGAPWGALPMLSMEGKPTIAQSHAILRMIGTQHGLLPTDPWESARHEGLMVSVEEARGKLGPTNRMKDPAEKQKAREALVKDFFPEWCAQLERQIQGPFFGGSALSVADIKLFVFFTPVLAGKIDHVPPAMFSAYPKLMGAIDAVKTHPRVVAWYAPR